MTSRIDTTLILGLGLIGGSLARSLRQTGFSRRVTACGHREASLARGVELGIIDAYSLDLDAALEGVDVVVIATPTLVAADMLRKLLSRYRDARDMPVLTDVASVKGSLHASALQAWEGEFPPRLVLGHPIAGSERSGVDAADAELFRHHRVILTPDAANEAAAVSLVREMWQSAGAEVVDMGVAEHDAVLAATSHLPHVLAYALVDALASNPSSEDIFRFAAGGFRDFTRIASSDPVMWRDIAIANRDAILTAIDQFSEHLGALRSAVDGADAEGMLDTFTRAKTARDAFAARLAARSRSAD